MSEKGGVRKGPPQPAAEITPAEQVSNPDVEPEPYYNEAEKEQLEKYKDEYKAVPFDEKQQIKLNRQSDDDEEEAVPYHPKDSGDDDEEQALRGQPEEKNDKETEQNKNEKGLLGGLLTKTDKKEKKMKNTEITIELPRDILTAYFLLRLPRDKSRGIDPSELPDGEDELPPYWQEYKMYGKVCLLIAVIMPYFIQFFVTFILMQELGSQWEDLQSGAPEGDFWYNTVAFAILFLYMWRDIASFYYSVWRYVQYLQSKSGGITSNLVNAVAQSAELAVATTKSVAKSVSADKDGDKDALQEEKAEKATGAANATATVMKFVEFRLWLISVLFLYFGLTCYSLLSIPLTEGLVDKLEVSLSVFFILEVDDWAYELFIAQTNILEDDEFDVEIIVKKERKGFVEEQQQQLAKLLFLVILSIFGFWLLSWGIAELSKL